MGDIYVIPCDNYGEYISVTLFIHPALGSVIEYITHVVYHFLSYRTKKINARSSFKIPDARDLVQSSE